MSPRSPAALLLAVSVLAGSCGGGAVKMDWDTFDGSPVELQTGDEFEVELGSNRMVSKDPDAYRWVLLEAGVLRLVSEEHGTRSEDPEEFTGGFSRYTVFTFEADTAGSADLVFSYAPTDSDDRRAVNVQRVPIVITE